MDQIRETLKKSHVSSAYIQGNWLVGCTQAVHEEYIALLPEILIINFTSRASGAAGVVLDLPVFTMMGDPQTFHTGVW